jgi:hypothetical protein
VNIAHGLATAFARKLLVDKSERRVADVARVLVRGSLVRRDEADGKTGLVTTAWVRMCVALRFRSGTTGEL